MQTDSRGQVIQSAAEIYETFFLPALFAQWPERLADCAQIKSGQRALDVACGTGVLARHLATRVGEETLVSGLDINAGMLAVAQQQSLNIHWQQGEVEHLPYQDHEFDAVFCQFGLMFFNDRRRAIQEMRRVLRPQGQLVIAVWDSLENTPGYAAITELLQQLFSDEVANEIRAPYTLGDRQMLTALFESAGVTDMEITTHQGIARFKSINDWIYTDIKGWTLADKLNDEQFKLLLKHAHKTLQTFTDANGVVSFASPAHIIKVK
jgi:ubiquinone/menaquinone biosynthesis C-methylase UbiE